eukprot:589032-Hanusia_phi.AAC.1
MEALTKMPMMTKMTGVTVIACGRDDGPACGRGRRRARTGPTVRSRRVRRSDRGSDGEVHIGNNSEGSLGS